MMSKIGDIIQVIITLLLVALLHKGLWELSKLISNASFVPSEDSSLVFWLSFFLLEVSAGLGLTGLVFFAFFAFTEFIIGD